MLWSLFASWMSMNENENLQLQRLVDGELDRQQIRSVLHQAESDPKLYRRIALAMIEDQIWQREILRLEAAGGETTPAAVESRPGELPAVRFSRQRNDWMRRTAPFLAAAAVMMMMTWLGYRTGQSRGQFARPSTPASLADQPRTAENNSPARGGPTMLDYAPYRMHLASNETGDPEGPAVPVMSYATARDLRLEYQTTEIPEALQQQFGRHGYRLHPEIQYLRGRTSDGRQLLMPLEAVRAAPWGQ
jgi:hypothetical protein